MLKMTMTGNVCSEIKPYTANTGKKLVSFSVAENEKRGGEQVTTYVDVTVFDGLAEVCEKYLRKGMKVYCEGRPSTRAYSDSRTGEAKSVQRMIANTVEFLSSGKGAEEQKTEAPKQEAAKYTPADDEDLPF